MSACKSPVEDFVLKLAKNKIKIERNPKIQFCAQLICGESKLVPLTDYYAA